MPDRTLMIATAAQLTEAQTRRSFLRMLGVGGSIVLLPSVFAACGDDSLGPYGLPPAGGTTGGGTGSAVTLDLSNDVGILNFAFALEQTEAAFYTMVMQNIGSSDLSQQERAVLSDIRDHEVIHREFYRTALGSARIPDIRTDFSTVRFNDRLSVLTTAATFEDTGVYAYNAADWGVSDPLKVPKTVAVMREAGIPDADIETIVWRNPVAFFGQSGRLDVDGVAEPPAVDQRLVWQGNSVLRGGQAPVTPAAAR